jgi:hypothetical protein
MDKPAHRVTAHQPQQPQNHKNHRDSPQHVTTPFHSAGLLFNPRFAFWRVIATNVPPGDSRGAEVTQLPEKLKDIQCVWSDIADSWSNCGVPE